MRRLLTATLLLLAAGACQPAQDAATPQPAPAQGPLTDAQARAVYDRACMSCHGPTGKGNGPRAAMLRTSPTDFTDPAWQAQAQDDALRDLIAQGRGSMPPFKHRLNPQEIDGVLRTVRAFAP